MSAKGWYVSSVTRLEFFSTKRAAIASSVRQVEKYGKDSVVIHRACHNDQGIRVPAGLPTLRVIVNDGGQTVVRNA